MADVPLDEPPPEIRRLVDATVRQVRADASLLSRALRARPASDAEGASPAVYAAIARAYRHVLDGAKQVRRVATSHESKALAMTALTLQASGLEAWDQSLRARSAAVRRRQFDLAGKYLQAAATAFLELDRKLGCPYGCKGQR